MPICCVLVPSTAVKTQDISQEEILLVVNSHNYFRAMIVKSQNKNPPNHLHNIGSSRKNTSQSSN